MHRAEGHHRHRRRAGEGLHHHAKHRTQATRQLDHSFGAGAAAGGDRDRSRIRGPAHHHLGDRAGQRRRAPGARVGDRGRDRRLRGFQPGRVPGSPPTCLGLQCLCAAGTPRGPRVGGRTHGPRAHQGRSRAIRRRPFHLRRTGRPVGRALHRRRRRHHRRGPGPYRLGRGHAHVRPRWSGVHQVAGRPPRPGLRGGRDGEARARHGPGCR